MVFRLHIPVDGRINGAETALFRVLLARYIIMHNLESQLVVLTSGFRPYCLTQDPCLV
jgi:hypothetical protein